MFTVKDASACCGVENDVVVDAGDDVERRGQRNRRRSVEVDRKRRSLVPDHVLEIVSPGPVKATGYDDEYLCSVLVLDQTYC